MIDIFVVAPGLLLASFFGSLVQRIAGMGFGIAVSGFALAIYDPFTAIYMSAIIGLGVTTITTVQMWRYVVWSAVRPIMAPICLSMLMGFALVYWVGALPPVRAVFQIFGLFAFMLALRSLLGRSVTSHHPWIARPWIGGTFTSFMSGTLGMPGPTIAPYFTARNIVGAAFVASITPVFIVTSATRIALGTGGALNTADIAIAFTGLVLAIAGVFVGSFLGTHVSPRWQYRMIITLLLSFPPDVLLTLCSGDFGYTFKSDKSPKLPGLRLRTCGSGKHLSFPTATGPRV